jgi:hypothetical protein
LVFVKELLEAGKVVPVIERRLRLSGIWKRDTPEEKSSSRWIRTTKPNKARIKVILEGTHESNDMDKIRTTRGASAPRGSKTCSHFFLLPVRGPHGLS